MDIKEAIGMVYIGREQPLEFDEAHEIVELLKRGEKYETMWEEFKDRCGGCEMKNYMGKIRPTRDYMEDYEQKYFPEDGD